MKEPMIRNARTSMGNSYWKPAHAQLGVVPFAAAAGRLLLPVAIWSGAIVGGGFLLKDSLGIDTSRIPLSAIMAGVGAAAFSGADLLPEAYRPVAALVGIGGVTAAIYHLFSPSGTDDSDRRPGLPPASAPNPVPNLPAGVLSEQIIARLNLARGGGTTRNMYADQEFNVSLRNDLPERVNVYVGVSILWNDGRLAYRTPAVDPEYGRELVSIDGGGGTQEAQVLVPRMSKIIWLPQSGLIEGEIFRNRDDATPILRTDATPITFGVVG